MIRLHFSKFILLMISLLLSATTVHALDQKEIDKYVYLTIRQKNVSAVLEKAVKNTLPKAF